MPIELDLLAKFCELDLKVLKKLIAKELSSFIWTFQKRTHKEINEEEKQAYDSDTDDDTLYA